MRQKKAFSAGQILTFAFGVIVVGLIFFVGTKAIMKFFDDYHTAQVIEFEKKFKKDVNKLTSEPDSSDEFTYRLPSRYDEICFIRIDKNPPNIAEFRNKYPLIYDSWKDGQLANVFLVSNKHFYSFYIGDTESGEPTIMIDEPYLCPDVLDSRVSLTFTGHGEFATIAQAAFE